MLVSVSGSESRWKERYPCEEAIVDVQIFFPNDFNGGIELVAVTISNGGEEV